MTASLREAAQLTLNAWQTSVYGEKRHNKAMLLAISKLYAALALPDEPVALRYRLNGDMQWQYTENALQATPPCQIQWLAVSPQPAGTKRPENCGTTFCSCIECLHGPKPAPVERQPLDDDQLLELIPDDDTPMSLGEAFVKFARAIEAAHGIK